MSRGYGKSRGFSVTASRDGGRSFYQHDDRQGSKHMPEGHWRGGGPPRGGGGRRGESSSGRGGRNNDGYYQSSRGSYRGDYSGGGKWRGGSRGSRGPGSRGPKYNSRGSRGKNYGSSNPPPSSSRLEDEDVVMEDEGKKSTQRYTPYGGRSDRGSSYSRNNRNDRPKKGGSSDTRPGSSRSNDLSWVQIKIPHGKKVEKQWLLRNLQEKCSLPFVPLDYHYNGESVIFYVDDHAAGAALKEVTGQIISPSGYKVVVLTKFCSPPSCSLTTEKLEVLKTGMSNRYNPSTKSLDLSDIYNDKELQQEKLYVELHKAFYMDAVVKIIIENIPEIESLSMSKCVFFSLKSMEGLPDKLPNLKRIDLSKNKLKHIKELEHLKGLKLEDLKLEGNPLCDYYKDKTDYVSDIRRIFPTVLHLDGIELPPPIAFELDESTKLPPVQSSFFVSDEVKSLIVPFVEKFFTVFDSGDRQLLIDAYHEQATFSLSIPTNNSSRTYRTNLASFSRHSRNLFKVKDSGQRFKLLKQSRVSVTAFLKDLPATQHDIRSFIVDVSLAQGTLLLFTVDGVFKEIDSRNPQIIAFSRIFLTHFDNRLLILNDELCLKCPTENQIKAAFPSAAPTPSHSPVLESSSGLMDNEKMMMVQQFSKDSGMNMEYSKMCLEETQWDYQEAGKLFSKMKAQGNISKQAFLLP